MLGCVNRTSLVPDPCLRDTARESYSGKNALQKLARLFLQADLATTVARALSMPAAG